MGRRAAVAVGSFGYVGFCPVAPGTAASAVAVALYYFLPFLQGNLTLVAASLVMLVTGWWATDQIIKTTHESDPSYVVFDEVAGQWIALLSPFHQGSWIYILLAFGLFRLFDIVKPFPASFFNRRSGAIHVFMDDVVAAIYANLGAHLLVWLIASV